MRKLIAFIFALFALGCGSGAREPDATAGVVHVENRGLQTGCTGALIAPNLVLTARHCVSRTTAEHSCDQRRFGATTEPQHLWVRFSAPGSSEIRLDRADANGFRARMVLMPDFEDDLFCGRDIAAIILSRAIAPQTAEPLAIRFDPPAELHEPVLLIGFGTTADPVRRERTGSWGLVDCRNITCEPVLTMAEWQGNPYSCTGDSGAPLLDGEGRVLGVASAVHLPTAQERCAHEVIAISVPYYADFVREAMRIAASL